MTYSKELGSTITNTKLRTPNNVSPFSGMCSVCTDVCTGTCEIGLSAIRGAEAISLASFPVDGQFVFQISICQDLQVETEVKLEVLGAFCSPRDNNIDCGTGLVCDDVTFPKQCPPFPDHFCI